MARVQNVPTPTPELVEAPHVSTKALPQKPISFEDVERDIRRMFINIKSQRKSYFTQLLEVLRDQKREADDKHIATYRGWTVAVITGVKMCALFGSALALGAPHGCLPVVEGLNRCSTALPRCGGEIFPLGRYMNAAGQCNLKSFSKDIYRVMSSFTQMVDAGKTWHDNDIGGDRTEANTLVDRLKAFVDLKVQEMLTEIREEDDAIKAYEQGRREREQVISRLFSR